MKYVVSIDQSTQGTKALLFDDKGVLLKRSDIPHTQYIDEKGWVEHDTEEIYANVLQAMKNVLEKADISGKDVVCLGISNQRETGVVWDRKTGKAVCRAVVWQCARGEAICERIRTAFHSEKTSLSERIQAKTGLRLSPYFTAAKLAWVLENIPGVKKRALTGEICCGTVDSWLLARLTGNFKTDYSNASRTQLFNIVDLSWDEELCEIFGIPSACLPEVCDSDSFFGMTDMEGLFPQPIPVHGVLGDSHGSLFGQACREKGMCKSTYGTGSSVMMNIGEYPVFSKNGLVTSLAWRIGRKTEYVLEGNINYTGAVITWLQHDLGLIHSPGEAGDLALSANLEDTTYLVPSFTGLGAPYWDSAAKASFVGMTRLTGKAELVRAAEDCIAYQITDILRAMENDSGILITELRVDGGPTRDRYLMQFQSDIADKMIRIPNNEELSGMGAAYAAGIGLGIYDWESVSGLMTWSEYTSQMKKEKREQLYAGWKKALQTVTGSNIM